MSEAGIVLEDYKHIEMFNKYQEMRDQGEKYVYIIATLSDEYNLSERTVSRIISRFIKYCQHET